MIWVKFGPNPQKIKEVEVTSSQKDSLITFMKTFIKYDQIRSKRPKKKCNSKVAKTKDPTPAPSTPPKKTKKVWRKKKKTSSPPTTSPSTDEMTSTWSGMEKGPAFRTLNQELAWGRIPPLSQSFFENNSRLQASIEQACITLFTISKFTTT